MAGEDLISTDWDIDEYRNYWDSDEQWEMRKRFMEHYKASISEDELVCLAQVFTNIEFLNCRYPDEVTKRVTELSCGIFDDIRESRRQRQAATINFVKESDDNDKQSRGTKRQSKLELPAPKHRPTEFIKPNNRSNAASYFTPSSQDSSNSNLNSYDGGGGGGNKYQMQNYYTSNYKSSQRNNNQWQGSGAPSRNEPDRNAANNADVSGARSRFSQ